MINDGPQSSTCVGVDRGTREYVQESISAVYQCGICQELFETELAATDHFEDCSSGKKKVSNRSSKSPVPAAKAGTRRLSAGTRGYLAGTRGHPRAPTESGLNLSGKNERHGPITPQLLTLF